MNFRRLMSLVGVVLTSLLMIAQTVQSFVLIASDAKAAKQAEKVRKPNRRLPPKTLVHLTARYDEWRALCQAGCSRGCSRWV